MPDVPVAAPAQHAFDGRVNQWCSYRGPLGAKCGKPANDPVHRIAWKVSSPSDLPVAAPDHAAELFASRLLVERRYADEVAGQKNSGHARDVTAWQAGVSYAEWFALTDALAALLAERQQDKERRKTLWLALECAADILGNAGYADDPDYANDWHQITAALAVEEDAPRCETHTFVTTDKCGCGAAVEEDTKNG